MKLRNLFMAVIAGAALLTGCNKEVDLGPAKIEMSTNTLTLSQGEASQAITFTATRDWVITGIPDWIAVSAEEGVGSPDPQKVTVSVNANSGFNRRADLIFTIGFARQALTIIQEGPSGAKTEGMGTKTDPYTVAGVKEYIGTLDGATSPVKVYIKGKISAIKEEFSAQYGNGNFTISEDGATTGEQFTAYRVLYLGNAKWKEGDTQIKVGDEVVLYGNVVLYNGTYETSQGNAFLYELNGVNKGGDEGGSGGGGESVDPAGDGSEANPFNVAAAIAKAKETGETATADAYYIKGKVAAVSLSAQYKNGDLDLVDVEGGVVFKAYRIKGFNGADITGNEPIVIGDEVVICGNIVNFKGNTPETTQGGKLVLWNGKTSFDGGGDQPGGETEPAGDGSQANPFNVAAAVNAVKDLTWTDKDNFDKVGPYYVKGKISSIKYTYSAQYGTATFNISDDGTTNGAQFTCYSVKYYNGEKWVEGNTQVNVGDEVLIYGELQNYQGNTPETVSGAYVVSIGGGDTPGGDTPGEGDGSQANPFNVAQAVDAVKNLTWTDKDNFEKVGPYYVKGTISSIKYTYSAQYGTATFNISDDGTTESTQFTCYSVKYYNGEKWVEGNTQVAVGDKVVIYGELQNYQGNTPETVSGSYVVSINADEPGGDQPGGDTPGGDTPGDVDFTKATTIKLNNESTWTAATDGTYKAGFETTSSNGIKVGVYKHASSSAIIAPDQYSVRVYKSAVIAISAPAGKKVLGVRFKANDVNSGQYCKPLTVIEGGSGVIEANAETFMVGDWTGNVDKVVFQAVEAQARLVEAYVVLDGESGGDQPGGDTPGGDTPGGDEPNLPVNDGLTEATAFTVQDAIYVAKNGVEDKEYYVKAVVGKDITIKNGTASFELLDGTTDGKLTVVKAKSFEGADFDGTEPLEWLDEVILKGKVTEYSTLPALLNGIFVKWNGKASFSDEPGGGDNPPAGNDGLTPETAFTASEANAWVLANLTSGQNTGEAKYYVKGKVNKYYQKSGTDQNFTNNSYHQATFYITNDGNASDASFEAYQINYLEGKTWEEGQTDVVVGDEVILYGPLARYNDIAETQGAGKAYLYSLNGKTKVEVPANDGSSVEKAFTASEANAWVLANLTSGQNTGEAKYYVKGKVYKYYQKSSKDQNFTNNSYHQATFFISDDGAESATDFEAYQINYLEGKTWEEGQTDVVVGDEVILYGPLARYNDIAETQGAGKAYLYSLNGVTTAPEQGGGDEPGGGDQPGGEASDITLAFPITYTDANKTNQYTTTWVAESGDYSWTIANFSNNNGAWNNIRCGRKNNASVATIALNQAPTFAISKVTVTFDAVNAPDKVNSSKLLVASDSDFTTDVQEIPVTIAAGDVDFTVTNPAANKYYKLVFDCASHTGNGFVQISKLVYKAQ